MKSAPAIIGLSLSFISISAHAEEAPPAKALLERTVVLDDVVGGTFSPGIPNGALFALAWITVSSGKTDSGYTRTVSTSLGIAPSADFFVAGAGLSVGGRIELLHQNQRVSVTSDQPTIHSSVTSRAFAPRVGYAFALSDHVVLWPRMEFELGTSDSTTSSGGSSPEATTHTTHFQVSGELALLFPIQRHVAFSLGPRLSYYSTNGDESLSPEIKQLFGSVRGALRVAF